MKMYPTPNTYDHKTNPGEDYQNWKVRAEKKKKQGISLHFALRQAVQKEEEEKRMYPTPTTQEVEHPNMVLNEKGRRLTKDGKDSHSLNLADTMRMYPTPNAKEPRDLKKIDHYLKTGEIRYSPTGYKHPRRLMLEETVIAEEKQKKMYPTPRSSGQENPETLIKRKGIKAAAQHNLTAAVKMYPTPTVGCEEGGEQSSRVERTKSGGFILRKKNKPESTFGAKLSDAMLYLEKEMLPTPTNSEHKYRLKGDTQASRCLEAQARRRGGKLNPTFVEFLMGFPMNWTKTDPTESKPSVTQSSHKSQESSD
jgi:hypothetical protein